MIEYERTFLLNELPKEIKYCKNKKEIIDIYIPKENEHPNLRIRKNGEVYEITKKSPVNGDSASIQKEHTIKITKEEFNSLEKLEGKILRKIRYYLKINGKKCEVDIFLDKLEGLALIDFEFKNKEEKENFRIPDFCLADVTEEEFIAGGKLAGKSFGDIKEDLKKYSYKMINIDFLK